MTTHDLARRFARGETDPKETSAVVASLLLEGPPADFEDLDPEPKAPAEAYADVFAQFEERVVALDAADRAERREAEVLVAALEPLDADARLRAVEDDPRYHTWAVAELLGDRSWEAGPEHPARSVALSRLAEAAAERVPAGPESPHLRADLLALTAAQAGNAARVAGDLRAAETALRRAEALLEEGSGDPLTEGRVLSLLASLRNDQSRVDEALELGRRALRCYRRAGDDHGAGRTLIKLATVHAYRDELDLACHRLDEAVGLLDPAAEPRLHFAARHNRAAYLERAGRYDEAAEELAQAEPLAEKIFDRLRLRWLAGRLTLRRGDVAAGERTLLEVRSEFLAHELAYETAQVSLELAVLYAEQGRTADQRRLAREMVPLFVARDLHPEARAALVLYCDAVRSAELSAGLARELVDYFDRAHYRRDLAFRPNGS